MDINRIGQFFPDATGSTMPAPNGHRPATSLERKQLHAPPFRPDGRRPAKPPGCSVLATAAMASPASSWKPCKTHGVEPVVLNSHLTALGLFMCLWKYREGHTILIEDCEQALASAPILGLLRSAFCGVNDERHVTYTSSVQFDMPSSFRFDSRIIICSNTVPKSAAFKALATRCLVFHLEPTQDEIIEQFHAVAARGFEELTPDVCRVIVDYVAAHAARRLCMRLLVPVFRTVQFALAKGIAWEPLVDAQLQELVTSANIPSPLKRREDDGKVLEEAVRRFPGVQDQLRYFVEKSGRSGPRSSAARRNGIGGNENRHVVATGDDVPNPLQPHE